MHVAIIMDGNGRWAERRGLKRSIGHRAGARAVARVVEAAARAQIDVLTLYAFSSDNWTRPAEEVAALMNLFARYLKSEVARCVDNGIRLNVIGRRDRLEAELLRTIERTESLTAAGRRLLLRLAVDYSARDVITRAAALTLGGGDLRTAFTANLAQAAHVCGETAPVDLLIRTGGERRLSDFLLWECAYAELVFLDQCWPDFDETGFAAALDEFHRHERRFGGLGTSTPLQRSEGAARNTAAVR